MSNLFKSLFIAGSLLSVNTSLAQKVIGSQGCVKMYGYADVTNRGAEYYAYITNECSDYILIEKSKYKVKFKGFDGDGDDKYKTKNINFPDVFLAPGTSIVRDRDRNDNGSFTYTHVWTQNGEMGQAWKGYSGPPKEGAIKIERNSMTYIGSKDGIDFYIELKTASDSWKGFDRYKVALIADNKTASKVKTSAYINYDVYFQGQPYSGSISIKTLKPNQRDTKSEKEKCIFNFEPEVYIVITSTNISTDGSGSSVAVEGESSSSSSSGGSSSSTNSNSEKTFKFNNGYYIKYKNIDNPQGEYDLGVLYNPQNEEVLDQIMGFTNSNNDLYAIENSIRFIKNIEKCDKNDKIFNFAMPENSKYKSNGKMLILTDKGHEFYEDFSVTKASNEYYVIRKKSKTSPYELVEYNSNNVLKSFTQYKSLFFSSNSPKGLTDLMLIGKNSSNKFGAINAFNETKIDFKYDGITTLKEGQYYKVTKNNGSSWKVKIWMGIVDKNGNEIIAPKYDYISTSFDEKNNNFIIYKGISVNTSKPEDAGGSYQKFPMEKYGVSLITSEGKQICDFGRLEYIAFNGEGFIANKKKFKDVSKISVTIDSEGEVYDISFPSSKSENFEEDRPISEFANLQELILFAE